MDTTISDMLKYLGKKTILLEGVQRKYADARIHKDRWGHERFASKSVNTLVDRAEIIGSCGCCPDAPINAWCYLVDTELNTMIYSDPPCVCIGAKLYGGGWDTGNVSELLNEHGLTNHDLLLTIEKATKEHGTLFGDDDEIEEEGS